VDDPASRRAGIDAAPIAPGLPRKEFLARVAAEIEQATDRIVAAGQAEQAQLLGRHPRSVNA